MRKRLRFGVGLVVIVPVFTVLVAWLTTPAEPQLRVGMEEKEAEQICGHASFRTVWGQGSSGSFDPPDGPFQMAYSPDPDWLGNESAVFVYYDENHRVTAWETTPRNRTRPPWLDKATKAVGW